jgi:hypothetical protein
MCIDEAQARGEHTVSPDSLRSAEARYGDWRRDVVLEEANHSTVTSPEDILDALTSWPRRLTPQELTSRLGAAKTEYGISETKPTIVKALVAWGVLGIERRGRDPQFIWDVRPGEALELGHSAKDAEAYYVFHRSLWSRLDLQAPPRPPKSAGRTA